MAGEAAVVLSDPRVAVCCLSLRPGLSNTSTTRKRMSAYSHNHTSSCVRRFCRSAPDRSVVFFFVCMFLHLLYSAFAVTIYLSLPEVFLFIYIYIYQFSFSRHWVVALLHQQNYHLTGRKTQTVHCFPIILFHAAFFFCVPVCWVQSPPQDPVWRDGPGTDKARAGNTVSSLKTFCIYTRRVDKNAALDQQFRTLARFLLSKPQ